LMVVVVMVLVLGGGGRARRDCLAHIITIGYRSPLVNP